MKKLISIILSIALVACMFGMTVGAVDYTVDGDKGQIGSFGGGNGIADGKNANEFPDTNFSKDVNLTVNGTNGRYAVDIVFGGSDYAKVVNGLTWNVNTLKYEVENIDLQTLKYDFTVTNYSDSAVYASVENTYVAKDTKDNNNEILTVDFVGDKSFKVEKNAHGDANPKTATVKATISPKTGENWNTVINKLVALENYTGGMTIKLATFTVTVSKTAPAQS